MENITYSSIAIRQYNEENHFLPDEELDTIDESEIDEYLNWCNRNNINPYDNGSHK